MKKKKEIKKKKSVDKMENPKSKLPDNIDEYFSKVEGSKEAFHSRELLKAEKDVDLKTDLSSDEIAHINTLCFNDAMLIECGIKPIYKDFLDKMMRLKFSLDRKSRGEFVNINRVDKSEEALDFASKLNSFTGSKK